MDFSSVMEKLRKVKEFLTDSVPDAMQWTADLLKKMEEGVRDAAQFLRELNAQPLLTRPPKTVTQTPKEDGETSSVSAAPKNFGIYIPQHEVATARDLQAFFSRRAAVPPAALMARRASVRSPAPATVEIAISRIAVDVIGRMIEALEKKEPEEPQDEEAPPVEKKK